MKLPQDLKKYFWDIDTKKANPKAHSKYYIERLLELGDKKAISWLKKTYTDKTIKETLPKTRLSPKSRNYWKMIFK